MFSCDSEVPNILFPGLSRRGIRSLFVDGVRRNVLPADSKLLDGASIISSALVIGLKVKLCVSLSLDYRLDTKEKHDVFSDNDISSTGQFCIRLHNISIKTNLVLIEFLFPVEDQSYRGCRIIICLDWSTKPVFSLV